MPREDVLARAQKRRASRKRGPARKKATEMESAGQKTRLCRKTPSSARERAVFRLAKTAKQAISVLSSMQPDAVRRKISRSKPDRVFRHSLRRNGSARRFWQHVLFEFPNSAQANGPGIGGNLNLQIGDGVFAHEPLCAGVAAES